MSDEKRLTGLSMEDAFVAGFRAGFDFSGEGYNGEYLSRSDREEFPGEEWKAITIAFRKWKADPAPQLTDNKRILLDGAD